MTTTAAIAQGRFAIPPFSSVKNPAMTTSADSSTAYIPKEDPQFTTSMNEMADGKMDSAEASPSDVLSQALDIIEITCTNEKQSTCRPTASGRPRRSSPPITVRQANPTNAANATSSFPAKEVAHHHSSMSTSTVQISSVGTHDPNQTMRTKLVRRSSTDSCSTATTASTSMSLVSSSSSLISSAASSPSNSPTASPKRRIFRSYWERNRTPRGSSRQIGKRLAMMSFPNDVPPPAEDSQHDQEEDQELSTFDGAATGDAISTSSDDQPSIATTPRSATVTLPEGYQHTGTDNSTSPKRSIFGDRAMRTAQRSSLPELNSIAATLITESTYTDYHHVHHVRKTSSTDHLVKVRKSCLRRGSVMRKSASTISTTAAADAFDETEAGSNLHPRPRASTLPLQPVVQFDPEVRVYEFQRTALEDSYQHHHRYHHHHGHASSNDWSHLFA